MWTKGWTLLALLLPVQLWAAATRDYADPDGAFAVRVPADWTNDRQPAADIGVVTQLGPQGSEMPPVTVLVVTSDQAIDPARLPNVAQTLLDLAKGLLQENGEVLSWQARQGRFVDREAVFVDTSFKLGGNAVVWNGEAMVALGRTHALLVFLTGPQDQPAVLKGAEEAFASLAIESTTPRQGGAAPAPAAAGGGRGLFTRASLQAAAQRVQASPEAGADEVLVAGEPPLTRSSVVSFIQVLSLLFDAQFTEAEFDLTRERFIEFYGKADAQGRQIIALGGANLLQGLTQGTAEQQAQNRQEGRAVFEQRLQAGAQAGIVWAQVLWEAIQRRSQAVTSTTAARPAEATGDKVDNEMSQADLDSALEMLYFMWVASGRDANLVTPEAVEQVRTLLVQGFPRFPAEFQYVLCNAERIYGAVRAAWQQADEAGRAQLAQQFTSALNDLGLTDPAAQQQGGGGGGGGAWWESDENARYGMVANTCWNLAQQSTGGAW